MKFSVPIAHIDDSTAFLEAHLRDLEQRLGIYVTMHDRLGWLRDASGNYLLPGRNLHPHPYCREGKHRNTLWDRKCLDFCKCRVEKMFCRRKEPGILSCWKGVKEVVVPVFHGELHVLTLFAGAFRGKPEAPEELPARLRQRQEDLPPLTRDTAQFLARLLYATGRLILDIVDELRAHERQSGDRAGVVARFIHLNAHRPDCGLDGLARELCLSRTRAQHVVKELFGKPFRELLADERMARAKVLLSGAETPLQEVADRVGIPNVYYFSRLFKKREGLPPGRFRRKMS